MPHMQPLAREDLPELEDLFRRYDETLSFVPNSLYTMSRRPEIMADAAHEILTRSARECTGNTFIDDEVLAEAGITDLSDYRFGSGSEDELQPDLFI